MIHSSLNGKIFSLVNSKVTQVFATDNTLGMLTQEGLEVLLHLS